MFTEPQTVTISGTAHTLPKVSSVDNGGTFSQDDQSVKMKIQHVYAKRTRRTIRIDCQKTSSDPVVPAQNRPYSASVILSVDAPAYGYTPAELKAIVDGFFANLNASSGANIVKFLGGES